ncbi:MAG: Gfo/Idh/MocA family oxidoreductase [Treponema sp.]|nr:Gfo/Idh/MocA family oxidoreductase [Treponema sp.]
MAKKINIAMLGTGFMGKAHSNGWLKVAKFFDVAYEPVFKVVAGRNKATLEAFAARWGYESYTQDWKEAVSRDDVDIVCIGTTTDTHKEMVVEAAKHGKAIFCEKPVALSYAEAAEMAEAVKKAGVLNYINHNYRRVPAVAYAKKLIDEGKLGTIYHWRGAYLQDWIMDPAFPLTWHLQKETASAGPLWDLGSHAVDLAHFLVGDIAAVTAINKTFIKERPLPGAGAATFTAGKSESGGTGTVTVDDASFMVADFANGALGSFDNSRFAGGRKNYNNFEIYGSKGSIAFNFERMNELQYLNREEDPNTQGFRDIMVTESTHPYAGAWWAPGHLIGYEHAFVHAMADFLTALKEGKPVTPNMEDGKKIMQVLEAAIKSSDEGRKVAVAEIT